MEEEITQEVIEKLMQIKGECRGTALKSDADFILKEEGKDGVMKLEEKMAELGYPIKYKNIKATNFFPIGLRAIQLMVLKKHFGFNREKFRQLGLFQTKVSLIVKIFMKFFVSLQAVSNQAPKMWRKHYTVGNLEVSKIDKEKKEGLIILKNFNLHPFHCQFLEGFFASIVSMIVGDTVVCEEIKCTFKGDDYHEFLGKW